MINFNKLKICFLAGQLGQGGAEQQLYLILKFLKKKGATLLLLSNTKGQYWEKRINDLGVPVKWTGKSRLKLMRVLSVIKEVRAFRPDIIQSQHFHMNVYGVFASKLFNAFAIGASRNDIFSEIRATGKALGYLNLRTPKILAANSRRAINNAISLGMSPDHLFFLPNVVDTAHYIQAPKHDKDYIQILGVGSLWTPKRFDRFLRIIVQLKQYVAKNLRVVIAGDGPLRMQLEKQAADLKLLNDQVKFIGNIPDVKPTYSESDILLLTSDHEGTPNVILEAMACGLPVVSTDVGGVHEIIKHGKTGYLSEPGDEKTMTKILASLVNDSNLRGKIGLNARHYVEDNLSVDRLSHNLEMLYSKILS